MKRNFLLLLCIVALMLTCFISCTPECEHPVSEEWTSDANNHWHATTCEHGEFRQGYAAHIDANEDSACDVCGHEVKHEHTFSDRWSSDEEKHWKDATCTHIDEKTEEGLHLDDDVNGECDTCKAHVHILDGAGFCKGCGKEIRPVVETDISSVIYATTARTYNVKNGFVDYYQLSSFKNAEDNGVIEHLVEFILGTNGTYVKMSYDEVETIGEYPNAVVNKTGKTEILEKWIKIVGDDAEGVSAISVDGIYKSAEPAAFGPDDLAGYYYAVSNLADGHGAEELLLNLYNAYLEYGIDDAVIDHDAEANTYDFSFKALIANKITVGGEASEEYAANYFEVSLTFEYDNDYTLLSLDLTCDCYTNDPGKGVDFNREEEIDFDYNYADGTFVMREGARPDKYEISVTQIVGTREEIELNDGSKFAPDNFELFIDKALEEKATDLEIEIGNNNVVLYIGCTPADSFFSFVKNSFNIVVKDANGNVASGLSVSLTGDVIYVIPTKPGSYVVDFTALGITKTVEVTVTGQELGGEHTFQLTTTGTYGWEDFYEFTPTTYGVYTFYFPAYFGVWEEGAKEDGFEPDIDYQSIFPPYNAQEEHKITVTLKPGQTFRFYYSATTVGTFTIGYDAP